MDYKISDSEWKVMEILWEKGAATRHEIGRRPGDLPMVVAATAPG